MARDAIVISLSDTSLDKMSSVMGVKHDMQDGKLTESYGCADTAVSPSASSGSSYSIITLKQSPEEVVMHRSPLQHLETVSVNASEAVNSSEEQRLISCANTSHVSACALSTDTTAAVVDILLTGNYDAGHICSNDVAVFVDRLERKVILRGKAKLKVVECTAGMYYYSPSFPSLPAIVESCRSDEALLSDTSIASGDGYVADCGLVMSESYASASSPTGSLCNVVPATRTRDDTLVTSTSDYGDHRLQLEVASLTVSGISTSVVSGDQQLSAKSSSDGIDSAVVCTPYSSQTSRDSSSAVDNAVSSYCQSVADAADDHAMPPLRSAADDMRPVSWETNEVRNASVTRIDGEDAGRDSLRQDSDDEMSMASLKVEWDIGSDSETTKHSEASVVSAPLIISSASFVPRPFTSTISSIPSLLGQTQELEMSVEPVPRRACCACMSCVIMRQCVSTAADVTPTISVRMCSSIVDVVCLIQRLIVVCSTWSQVMCDPAFRLERFRHSQDYQCSDKNMPVHPTSADRAACNKRSVCDDFTDSSARANLQYHSLSEGLENVRENLVQRLINVSNIRRCCLCR